jgi:hypothetical protein
MTVKTLHVLGTPVDVPGPEREQLIRLGLLYVASCGPQTRHLSLQDTASKRSKRSGASKPTATK